MRECSPRLQSVLDRLPLAPGARVLEIGCGSGVLARAMARRIEPGGWVLGLDRSPRAIAQACAISAMDIAAGRLALRQGAIEDFTLASGERPFDLVVAVRVGALDGRHPERAQRAWTGVRSALKPGGRVFVDGFEIDH